MGGLEWRKLSWCWILTAEPCCYPVAAKRIIAVTEMNPTLANYLFHLCSIEQTQQHHTMFQMKRVFLKRTIRTCICLGWLIGQYCKWCLLLNFKMLKCHTGQSGVLYSPFVVSESFSTCHWSSSADHFGVAAVGQWWSHPNCRCGESWSHQCLCHFLSFLKNKIYCKITNTGCSFGNDKYRKI